MDELISIIVPVYNVEKYLKRCLETIVKQTYSNIEIVLVDDGATDTSGSICEQYASIDNRIKVIHKDNGGLSDARNAGLEVAHGVYITCIDSDDYVEYTYVEKLYNLVKKYNADISIGSWKYVYYLTEEFSNVGQDAECGVWNSEETLKHMLLQQKITCSACGNLVKREFYQNVRFPKGKLYEDLGTSYKLYAQAQKVVYTTEILYYYYVRENSIQNTGFSMNRFDELEFALDVKKFIDNQYPQISAAATTKLVSTCFHILFFMENFHQYPDEALKLKKIIQMYRKKMVFGGGANKKVRMACLSSYLGFDFTKRMYDAMGMRGKMIL